MEQGNEYISKTKVTVIIPVRNEADGLSKCLEAVFAQTYQPYEVIVVDGHSTDETVSNATRWPIKLLYEEYRTRAGACQVGLMSCDGDYVAFTDADCIPDPDWLKMLVNEFDDSRIVGLGGVTKTYVGRGILNNSIQLALGTFLGSGESVQFREYNHKHLIKSPTGCNCMYRKDKLIEIGGFNPALSGGEDGEINKRLSRLGNMMYVPGAIVWHYHKMQGLKQYAKRMYQYGIWRSEGRTWALQVVPPLATPILLLSLLVTPWIFVFALLLYITIVVALGIKLAIQYKKIVYTVSIPFVCGLGHALYIIGFWRGVPLSFKMKVRD